MSLERDGMKARNTRGPGLGEEGPPSYRTRSAGRAAPWGRWALLVLGLTVSLGPGRPASASPKLGLTSPDLSPALPKLGLTSPDLSPALPALASPNPRGLRVAELRGPLDSPYLAYLERQLRDAESRGEDLLIDMDSPGLKGVPPDRLIRPLLGSKARLFVWVGPGAKAAGGSLLLPLLSDLLLVSPLARLGPLFPLDLEDPRGSPSSWDEVRDLVGSAAPPKGPGPSRLARLAAARSAGLGTRSLAGSELAEGGGRDGLIPLPGTESLRGDLLLAVERATRAEEGQRAAVTFTKPGPWARLLHTLGLPLVAYALILGGFMAVVLEIYRPGWGIAGATGAACLALGLVGAASLPTWWPGAVGLLAGLLLLTLDVHRHSLSLPTWTGTALVLLGSFWLFRGASSVLRVPLWAALLGSLISLAFFGFVMTVVVRSGPTARPDGGHDNPLPK